MHYHFYLCKCTYIPFYLRAAESASLHSVSIILCVVIVNHNIFPVRCPCNYKSYKPTVQRLFTAGQLAEFRSPAFCMLTCDMLKASSSARLHRLVNHYELWPWYLHVEKSTQPKIRSRYWCMTAGFGALISLRIYRRELCFNFEKNFFQKRWVNSNNLFYF